jgi:hypothetical protein
LQGKGPARTVEGNEEDPVLVVLKYREAEQLARQARLEVRGRYMYALSTINVEDAEYSTDVSMDDVVPPPVQVEADGLSAAMSRMQFGGDPPPC